MGPSSPSKKWAQQPRTFLPMSIVAKRLGRSTYHLVYKYRIRLWPWPHCVRWGPSSPRQKKQKLNSSPTFRPMSWSNGWMHQDGTTCGGRPRPRRHCVTWGHSSPQKGDTAAHTFRPMYSGQTAGWIKMLPSTEVGLGPVHFVLNGIQLHPKKKNWHSSLTLFCPCLL